MFSRKAKSVLWILICFLFLMTPIVVFGGGDRERSDSQRLTIRQYNNLEEAIEDLAKESGLTTDEIKEQIEQSRQNDAQQKFDSRLFRDDNITMGLGGHWANYIPSCWGPGTAWGIWETDPGTGTVEFWGSIPLEVWRGNWSCSGPNDCTMMAWADMWAGEEIWTYRVKTSWSMWTNNLFNYCTGRT